jgi:hypothetical protein
MGLGESGKRFCAIVLALVLPGCAALRPKHADAPIAAPPQITSSASQPDLSSRPSTNPPAQPPPSEAPPVGSSPAKDGSARTKEKIPAPPARSAAKAAPASDTRKAQPPSSAAAAAAAKSAGTDKPSAPALDLSSLEQRLKDTRAIGVFTKLSLKNQVDDLLAQFRAFHQSSTKTPPPADLRQQYDSLIVKVLALLQTGDPQLAAAIASSREAIWGILVDPEKFAKI